MLGLAPLSDAQARRVDVARHEVFVPKSQGLSRPVGVYIDGFNLYHAVEKHSDQTIKWLNHKTLATGFCGPSEHLACVVFFTAVLTWNHAKQQRHRNFIAAQQAFGVEVIESNFRKAGQRGQHEEKQTDVAIALRMFRDATEHKITKQVLITADSDQIPTVKHIKQAAPETHIVLAAPPGRETVARELGQHVHERRPLTFGRLMTCRLPHEIRDERNRIIAQMPAIYRENR